MKAKSYNVVYNQKNGRAAVIVPIEGDGFSDVPVQVVSGSIAVPCACYEHGERRVGHTVYSKGDLIPVASVHGPKIFHFGEVMIKNIPTAG